jgi:hypothetical protein
VIELKSRKSLKRKVIVLKKGLPRLLRLDILIWLILEKFYFYDNSAFYTRKAIFPFKQIKLSVRKFSTKTIPYYASYKSDTNKLTIKGIADQLNPLIIVGFVDAEGSFIIRIRKNPKFRVE